jgi:hypothetical protein
VQKANETAAYWEDVLGKVEVAMRAGDAIHNKDHGEKSPR